MIDEGIGFILERFMGGRFPIMGRRRGVGDNSLDRRRGIFFCLVSSGEVGVSERQWLNGGGQGGFHPPSLSPFVYQLLEGRLAGLC